MKNLALKSVLLLSFGGLLSAQETPKYTFNVGAGFTTTVGGTNRYIDNPGWNLQAGAGYNFSPRLGIMLDTGYNSLGINNTTLSNVGFYSGTVRVFTATVDPVVHLNPKGHVDVYAIGGGGLFHQSEDFGLSAGTAGNFSNSLFSSALSNYSVNKPGYDVGAGVAFGTKFHGKVFAEARYYHMFNTDGHTDFIPVTFGFRW